MHINEHCDKKGTCIRSQLLACPDLTEVLEGPGKGPKLPGTILEDLAPLLQGILMGSEGL